MKKILSIVLAAIMVMALGVTAFAAETDAATIPSSGQVLIYKDGSTTEISMANRAIDINDSDASDGTPGTYTTVLGDDGYVTVTIPIEDIHYMGFLGCINTDTSIYAGTTEIEYEVPEANYTEGCFVLYIPASCFYAADGETLVNTIKLDIAFGIDLDSSSHLIQTSMDTVADMYIYVNPNSVS